jgi:DNA-binding NarL/FixJ family response regulator
VSTGPLPTGLTAPRIRVTLADDHPLVLTGLYHLLREYPEFEVLDRCKSGSEAMAAVRRQPPDVLLLDLQMPDIDGLTVARTLHQTGELPRTVLLTAQLHEDQLIEALHLGIRGFVLKEMAPTLLVECLRRVHAGGQWLEKDAANRAMAKLVRREAKGIEIARLLTPREIEVVKMVAKGLTNKEIADRLYIAGATVKIHLHNIYEKLKINRRAELVRFADEYGLS